jgi:hypothetical protein
VTPTPKAERNAQILTARVAGRPWSQIAADHGISRARARQIVLAAAARERFRAMPLPHTHNGDPEEDACKTH